jgi:hypothetical protein
MKEDWNCGVSTGSFAKPTATIERAEINNTCGFNINRSMKGKPEFALWPSGN